MNALKQKEQAALAVEDALKQAQAGGISRRQVTAMVKRVFGKPAASAKKARAGVKAGAPKEPKADALKEPKTDAPPKALATAEEFERVIDPESCIGLTVQVEGKWRGCRWILVGIQDGMANLITPKSGRTMIVEASRLLHMHAAERREEETR